MLVNQEHAKIAEAIGCAFVHYTPKVAIAHNVAVALYGGPWQNERYREFRALVHKAHRQTRMEWNA